MFNYVIVNKLKVWIFLIVFIVSIIGLNVCEVNCVGVVCDLWCDIFVC